MSIHPRGRLALPLAIVAGALSSPAVQSADDWPQLWGPGATASAATAPVAADAPEGVALHELWRRPIGSGFSGIAVSGERGYTGESDGTSDQAIAFDVATGRTLWRAPLGETYRGHDGSRDGPIATPAVSDGRVFMAGPRGVLLALDATSGRELWRRDLLSEPGRKAPFYGFGASPIVAAGRVVVQVGGPEKSGLAAFDAVSGRPAWAALVAETKGDSAGYTMAVPATIGGEPQLVVTAHDRVFAVRAGDGALAWSHALDGPEEPTRAPLALPGDRVLVSRGTGSVLLQLAREGNGFRVSEAWRSPRLKGGLSPTVHEAGWLYGFGGQYLLCVDTQTGEPRWREKTNSGALIRVGRHLLLLGELSGLLRVVEASASGYRELGRAAAFNAGAQSSTGPSYAGGRLFVRNVEELVAYELRPSATADVGGGR